MLFADGQIVREKTSGKTQEALDGYTEAGTGICLSLELKKKKKKKKKKTYDFNAVCFIQERSTTVGPGKQPACGVACVNLLSAVFVQARQVTSVAFMNPMLRGPCRFNLAEPDPIPDHYLIDLRVRSQVFKSHITRRPTRSPTLHPSPGVLNLLVIESIDRT
ncbi:hypothetical protein ANN_24329 [Periplaneta americana]|uniref:Uncharacterized protein n=1 Tax=Periplaneta americana TaxID=6978 RepID=A0ABQ8S3I8_PERAM|nr:hypothetical protein ANN_24329 [Periplaneta americana]